MNRLRFEWRTEIPWWWPGSQPGRARRLDSFPIWIGKLKLALQQKGVPLDESASFRVANGNTVVVAGLATGPGEAARLISDLDRKAQARAPAKGRAVG